MECIVNPIVGQAQTFQFSGKRFKKHTMNEWTAVNANNKPFIE